jgi:hypothetical protein
MRLQTPALALCIVIAILFSAAPLRAQVTISTSSLPEDTVGSAYSQTVHASGGTLPYTWSITAGSLPAGLDLNIASGAITGTPTSAGAPNFTIQVTDNAGATDSKSLVIQVNEAVSITTTALNNGTVGSEYSEGLSATGGTAPLSWNVTSGNLPDGLALNSSTGMITGTPTMSEIANFTVVVVDGTGAADSQGHHNVCGPGSFGGICHQYHDAAPGDCWRHVFPGADFVGRQNADQLVRVLRSSPCRIESPGQRNRRTY